MKILVSGASGLVGSALVPALTAHGHQVTRLVRSPGAAASGTVAWDPAAGRLDAAAVADCDAIINLSGESVAGGRWTERRKRQILDSRLAATGTVAQALAAAPARPRVLINASATGIYGNRGDEPLSEASPAGSGDFLTGVCRAWEAAAEPAVRAGVRVVCQRFGIILSARGGALAKMLFPFRLGLGGRIGDGRQFMSWIAIDDAIGATLHALQNSALAGPVNVVAPQPVTNAEFTRALGRALRRPTIFPMPAFAARLAFGQMADELLLVSQRIEPARLLDTGFRFECPDIDSALARVLSTT